MMSFWLGDGPEIREWRSRVFRAVGLTKQNLHAGARIHRGHLARFLAPNRLLGILVIGVFLSIA